MTQNLVRTRKQVDKLSKTKNQIQAIAFQIQTIKTNVTMAKALHNVTSAMTRMNRIYNIESLGRVITEFQTQINLMNLKSDVIDDTCMFLAYF